MTEVKVGDLVKPICFHEEAQETWGLGLVTKSIGRLRGQHCFVVYFMQRDEEMNFFRDEVSLVSESR